MSPLTILAHNFRPLPLREVTVTHVIRATRTLAVAGLAWFGFLYLMCWLCDRQVGP